MPIDSASTSALRVARSVKRRRRAEGGAVYDPMSGIRIGGESPVEPAPDPQGALSKAISRLTGTQFGEPRYQLWPEKMVRSGVTLAGDVLSGSQATLPPGLRREDYTDAPAPSEPTQDSTWLGRRLGVPPVQAQPNDPMMERAQDMAGMAGGQTLLTGAAGRVSAAQRALVAAADSQATGAPLAAVEHAPKFYSGLERAVEAIPQPKMTGEQWLGTLSNRGVKPEEMDWTGLRGFLAERGNQPVTKAQVAEHLGANKLELGEVHKGKTDIVTRQNPEEPHILEVYHPDDPTGEINGMWGEIIKGKDGKFAVNVPEIPRRSFATQVEAERYIADNSQLGSNTKYHNYQLPGGENYREKLLTLPPTKVKHDSWSVVRPDGQVESTWANPESATKWAEKIGGTVKQNETINLVGGYRSSHWDEPNVLVHRRTNERDVNGQRSLHIEEIQSDWHQKGRKEGYETKPNLSEDQRAALLSERDKIVADAIAAKQAIDLRYNAEFERRGLRDASREEKEAFWAPLHDELAKDPREIRYIERINELNAALGEHQGGVADAPFKKNWHELALKDAIREAAERGIDRISWTPGEAQAARYDLSKQIDELHVIKDGDQFMVTAKPVGSRQMVDVGPAGKDMITADELANYVGKDMAKKISEQKDATQTYSGVDLKVGGEGMRGFYDKIIPDALNKIGKPHGVKVDRGTSGTSEGKVVPRSIGGFRIDGPNASAGVFSTRAQAEVALHSSQQPVHYMDIPQSLKDQVLQKGFSLFEDSASVGAPLAGAQNDSDLVAELLAEQEGRKKTKKSAMPVSERKSGGPIVNNPAMNVARSIKRAKGGRVHVGPIVGSTGGRADKVPMEVPNGSYVLTSDHVSSMGEGNTLSGFEKLKKMFPKSVAAYKAAKAKGPPKRAAGGRVPILAADGEFVVCPEDILDRYGDLDHGHHILDHWQTTERKNHIATLSKLAPPAQD